MIVISLHVLKCSKCDIDKSESEFGINKRYKNHRHRKCKQCYSEYYKQYNRNSKARRMYLTNLRIKNQDYKIPTIKKCPTCNRILDPDEFYRDKRSTSGLTFRCKKCTLKNVKESNYVKSGKGKKKAARTKFEYKIMFLKFLGGKCTNCGNSNLLNLQIDHIDNDGNKDRKDMKTSTFDPAIIKKIMNGHIHPYRLQVLCANCNYEKRLLNMPYFKEFYEEYMNHKGLL